MHVIRDDGGGALKVVAAALLDVAVSDEASLAGQPNFAGTFVGMVCQDTSGAAAPADFAYFRCEGV